VTLSELIRMLSDFAQLAVTVLLAFVVYKIAVLIDSLSHKIKEIKSA